MAQADQDPSKAQDAEAERQKLLKAADQLDMIETGYEATRASLETMKTQVAKLTENQTKLAQENEDLKTQIATLQAALAKSEEDRAAEQKVLLAQVADLIANSLKKTTTHKPKAKVADDTPPTKPKTADDDAPTPVPEVQPTPAPTEVSNTGPVHLPSDIEPTPEPTSPPEVVQHGYNHIVAEGETLAMIAKAYREQGVKVYVSDICKANNITSQTQLKVGQKLFIPRL
jgi:regulator of replication initiation timing